VPNKAKNKDEKNKEPLCEFTGWTPQTKSSILIGEDGAQIKLELAETDIDAALLLARHGRNRLLRVEIYADD
jgi:hypothetical protein